MGVLELRPADVISGSEFELMVEALLEEGVPTNVLARAFHLDEALLKEALSKVRVRRYGTDDYAEYVEQLNWAAIEEARRIIAEGTPTEKARIMTSVFGKQIAANRNRTPEGQRDARQKLDSLMGTMRDGGPEEENGQRSAFVVGGEED